MTTKFRALFTGLCFLFLIMMSGCSSEPSTQNSAKQTTKPSESRQLEPVELQIGLTHTTPRPIFEDVYKQKNKSLSTIKKLNFQSMEPTMLSDACNSELDMLFIERSLSERETQTCKQNQFEPIDFTLATLNNSGDTVYLYARKDILSRRDVRTYLQSIFNAMTGPLPDVTRYKAADTGLVNRNRGLLSIHGG